MIKIKLSPMGNKIHKELEIKDGEFLTSAVTRSLDGVVKEDRAKEFFIPVVNGKTIHKDLWDSVKLQKTDTVLISPKISGGDASGLFKTALIIAATVYTGGALAGAGIVGVSAGLITAGVSIGVSLLLNSLIPPPVPEGLDIGSGGDLSGSQMYSISGQSNQTRKFGTVPKIYGEHKIFPPLAANPYTELETDPDSGALIQYLYAIYDFGMGPMQVGQINIGDTPITEFSDYQFNLVDFNRPETPEGDWDLILENSLQLYKGDLQREDVSVALNKNQSPLNNIDDYLAIRNAPSNTFDSPQEVSLTFVCPNGLYALNSSGTKTARTIEIQIEFSKIGEENWHGFNDPVYCDNVVTIGAASGILQVPLSLFPLNTDPVFLNPTSVYSILYTSQSPGYVGGTLPYGLYDIQYGYDYGETEIVLATADVSILNKYLVLGYGIGTKIGKVIAETPHSPGYTTYTIDTPLAKPLILFNKAFSNAGANIYDPAYSNVSVTGKCKYETISLGTAKITRADFNAMYSTFKFTPKEVGSYKIRVTRINTYSGYSVQTQDNLSWVGLTSRFDRDPIITDKRHVFMELKIRATNQLNGTIQNLSAVCASVLDVYDSNTLTWNKEVTSNPAWVFADLLTGEVNKRAIDKSRLDTASLVEWAEFCDEVPTAPPSQDFTGPRFQTNLVVDFSPTLQSLLNQVCNAAQASLNIIDGKYGVLVDKLKTVPVQIFTQRNSKGFTSSRSYTRRPHGIKVSYIDRKVDWESREIPVYDNGYDENNATEMDEITSFACTSPEQAWRLGRYMLAQNRLRQENISLTVDFENLVCTRGDFVQISQDVMKVGGSPARVRKVTGNQIEIDDAIETGPYSYGFVYRAITGEIYTDTLTVVNAFTFDLDGPNIPQVGDLIVIGIVGNVVLDCIVKAIEPSDDLSATILLVEKADAIYDAESTDTLPDYEPQISPAFDTEFLPPGEVEDLEIADSFYECTGAGLDYKVTLDWGAPLGAAYDVFEIWVDSGQGYNFVDTTKETIYTYTATRENLGNNHKFKVVAVSAGGKKLELGAVGSVEQAIEIKSTRPDNIEFLNIDITGEVLQLIWTRLEDCSVREYLIRYSPSLTATWETSIPLLRADKNLSLSATQARTGTYLIKAVDYEENESEIATAAITTIPELFNLNIIDEINDFPALAGSTDKTEVGTGAITLDLAVPGDPDLAQYYSEGYYYYSELLDLGDIYTARLQSLVEAEGFSLFDLMENWENLEDLDAMSQSTFSDWAVETQYRTTDVLNVISEWSPVSDVIRMSDGDEDVWTEWKNFTITDATGKIFAFRLKLISNKTSVTPRVVDGKIRIDMADRVESYEDISAPSSGVAIDYDPAFKGPGTTPNVQISLQDGQAGDYWSFDYKTLDGFYIRFFDSDSNPVARSFDAAIKGYGRKAEAVI